MLDNAHITQYNFLGYKKDVLHILAKKKGKKICAKICEEIGYTVDTKYYTFVVETQDKSKKN